MAAGGKAINLGELAIAIALKTGALEQGLKQVQKQLKDHGKKIQGTSKDYDKLAIAAGLAFWKITSSIGSGVKAFNDFNNSMVGLRSIVQGTGNSFQEAQGFINDFISDGLITAADAATALKNLLARGFELGEATTIMNRFKDSAAFGRQAALTLGEAVRSATEGLKNENSILVDNAGVTKNVSVMWKEYAAELGKGVDSLTVAEKRQAELNGIMHETRFQLGDAAKYANEFAGAQAKNAAESLKLSQALGSTMAPVLQTLYSILNPIISVLTKFTQDNPALVAAVISIATAFLGLITIMGALGAASKILAPALTALNVSFGGFLVNPIVLTLTTLVGVLAAVSVKTQQARKAQETYNAAVAEHNKLIRDGMNAQQAASMQTEVEELKKLAATYEETAQKVKEAQATIVAEGQKQTMAGAFTKEHREALAAHADYTKVLDETIAKMKELGATEEDYIQIIKEKERAIFLTTKTTTEDFNAQAKIIAQKKADVLATQAVINAYKTAEKGSAEWLEAEKKLAESFPQFASMSGIKIEAIEKATQAQADSVEAEWKLTQAKIRMTRMELQEIIDAKSKELAAILAVQEALEIPTTSGGGLYGLWATPDSSFNKIKRLKSDLEELRKEVSGMKDLENIDLENIMGVKPLDLGEFKSYENAALDSALRVLNHKKRMNQLSLEDELKTLESISKKYIQTADERMDIDERIYDARQAIIARDKKTEEDAIEASNEAMRKRTQSSLDWIESKKHIGDISVQDELAAYDRIIMYHRQYLDKLLAGKKELSKQEQEIREEEEQQIKDFEKKKYDIQKSYQEQLKSSAVDDINDLSAGVESALRKRYEKEKELREQALSDAKKDLDEWKKAELDRVKDVYDSRIEAINATTKAQKKAIQDEIDSLDQSVKEKDRGEIDASEIQKINAIKERIQYEHDERNKIALQKELEKLQKNRENRLYKESVEDHKDSLRAKLTDIQENADRQKEILKQQQENEIARIQTLYDNEKRSIENRQAAWKAYYQDRLSNASLQAEAEKLIIKNNQDEIVTLLKGYGEDYKIVGQTLGEKLYEGFKPQVDAIRTLIANITAEINSVRDKALNAAVKASSPPVTSGSSNQTAGKTVTVNQTNNFNVPGITPSEAARKQLQASRQLAQELG